MRWFFALNAECTTFSPYAEMVQVAVWSARANTRLEPHFLYDGDDDPPLLAWLRGQGVEVWRCRSRYYPALCELATELNRPDARTCGGGAFLRVEITDLLRQHDICDEHVLYTDCDVMFRADPEPILRRQPCRFFACAPEALRGTPTNMNTGVMLLHVPALARLQAEFVAFTRAHLREFVTIAFDQTAYQQFYRGPLPRWSWPWRRGWDVLPDELNWKPYWGPNSDAIIVHFHGPKPFHRAWLQGEGKDHMLQQLAGGDYLAMTHEWYAIQEKLRAASAAQT